MNAEDRDLLAGYLNGVLNDAELARVERLLLENPRAARRLAELSMVECMLWEMGLQAGDLEEMTSSMVSLPVDLQVVDSPRRPASDNAERVDVEEVRRRAERQLQADLAEQEALRRQQQNAKNWSGQFSFDLDAAARKVQACVRLAKKAVLVAACVVVTGLVAMGGIEHVRARQVVAHLGDTVQAQWADPPQETQLRRGRLQLDEGFAQLKFAKGAEVVLQAPCLIELCSPRKMSLESGIVSAKVGQAGKGFTVETPRANVVDFGTAFGVAVDALGQSEIHVFEGEVGVESSRFSGMHRLQKGLAGWTNPQGRLQTGSVDARCRLFVQGLPTADRFGIPGNRLDLADIVGGGNGFGTGQQGYGIDPLTGRYAPRDPRSRLGRGTYVLVKTSPFIDGVFAPFGSEGRVVVTSSEGHVFQECPKTNGMKYAEISNTRDDILYDVGNTACKPRLGDQVYDTAAHPHIYLHANAGITFDLGAIRDHLTGPRLRRFTAQCGMCAEQDIIKDAAMDLWVLVDGKVRFVYHQATATAEPVAVDVQLHAQDRFLTLVATEGPDGSSGDLGLFAEPALILNQEGEMR